MPIDGTPCDVGTTCRTCLTVDHLSHAELPEFKSGTISSTDDTDDWSLIQRIHPFVLFFNVSTFHFATVAGGTKANLVSGDSDHRLDEIKSSPQTNTR